MGNLDCIENKNVEPVSMGFDPMPPGKYKAMVEDSEVEPTSSGLGVKLKTTHVIVDGEYKNRKVFTNFNIKNPSEKAEQIGRGMLSSLSKACGMIGIPDDSNRLHNKPHWIKLGIEQSPGYEPRNVIRSFSALEGATATAKVAVEQKEEDDIPF